MSKEQKLGELRLVGDNELPRTLRELAGYESSDLRASNKLQLELGKASFWLQTYGDIYGIRTIGSDDARLLRGGSFYIPVSYVGTRWLDHVDTLYDDGTLITVTPPGLPVAIFNISHNVTGDAEYMDTDIADCLQIGVRTEQAITLLDDNEYLDSLKGAWAYPQPVLVVDNTRKHVN